MKGTRHDLVVMDKRRAEIMLDRLVTAGGATESDGTYTGVLVEDNA